MTKNNKQAFTLIELLVVVLIIGILAAVALPQYQKAVKKASIMQVLPFARAVYDAQQVYFLENGAYAPNVSQLNIDISCPKEWTCVVHRSLINSTAVAKVEAGRTGYPVLVMYYGNMKIGGVEVKGKMFCSAPTTDTANVSVCKLFNKDPFTTSDGYSRFFI